MSHRYRLYLIYLTLLLPAIVYGAAGAMRDNANSPLDWVPSSFPPRAAFDHFLRRFGSGDLLIVGWPECRIDDGRLDAVESVLRESSVFRSEAGSSYFESVTSGRRLLGKMAALEAWGNGAPLRRRLRGSWIGPDGRSTYLMIAFTPAGLARRAELVDLVRVAVHRYAGVAYDDIHLAGPVADGWTVDRASQRSLSVLALPSSIVVFLLSWWCLKQFRAALIVFGVAALSQGAALALVYYGGETMNALLIVLPPLIQVLAMAGGLHLANYYSGRDGSPSEAARRAWRQGWLPCLLSGGTTALGLASLSVSQLTPVRLFGLYGALGVMVATALVLSLVPGLFVLLRVAPMSVRSVGPLGTGTRLEHRAWVEWFERHWQWAPWVVACCMVAVLGAASGLGRLRTSVRIETLFSSDSRILNDYRWLEQRVGPLVPIEVLLEWKRGDTSWQERLRVVREIEQRIGGLGDVESTLSAATWIPEDLTAVAPPEWTPEALLSDIGFVRSDETTDTYRITALVSALADTDYSQLLRQVAQTVDRGLEEREMSRSKIPTAVLTGTMPLVHAIQRQLMRDLLLSVLGALGLVTIVMTLVQGGWWSGIASMIPNVFPVVILFGILGWFRAALDIGSVMTASVALGIAVDDTLHFLVAYRRALHSGASRPAAVATAYGECARAMVQTSLVCGLGLLLFALSDFVPTRRFAWMMGTLLALALLGDLLLLPALLLCRRTATASGAPPACGGEESDSGPVRPRRRSIAEAA